MKKLFSAVACGAIIGLCGIAQANTITTTGTINRNNIIDDWYFNLSTGSSVTVQIDVDKTGGSYFDSSIYLLTNNSTGTASESVIAFSDDNLAPGENLSQSYESYISSVLGSGSYQISISEYQYTLDELMNGTNAGQGDRDVDGNWSYLITVSTTCGTVVWSSDVSPSAVPEPTTMLLFGAGVAGLAAFGRRKAA